MELDWAITFLIVAGALFGSVAAVRNRAWRWLGVQILNVVVVGAAWLFARQHVVAIVAPVWLLTVLGPNLAVNLADRAARAERLDLAYFMARIAAILHPNATTKVRVAIADVQRHEQAARIEETRAAIARLAKLPHAEGTATVLAMRLDRRWDDLRAWFEAQSPQVRATDATAISFYLRALGELGDTDALAAAFARLASSPAMAVVEGQVMLLAAAFGGREAALETVLAAHHAQARETTKRLWRLTAARAAGKDVRAEFAELAKCAEPRTAKLAQERVDARSPSPISPEAAIVFTAIDRWAGAIQPSWAPPLGRSMIVAIAAVNVYAFLREIPGGTTNLANLDALGALDTSDFVSGELWRVATATVLHFGTLHIAMNLLGLFVLGRALEKSIGRARVVFVYVVSGLAANVLGVLWTKYTHGHGALLVGASGCVMGIAGAQLARLLVRWRARRSPLARREALSLVSMFVLQIVFDAFTPHVAGPVHMFGAAVGAILALVVGEPRRREGTPLPEPMPWRARFAVIAVFAVSVGALEMTWHGNHASLGADMSACQQENEAACTRTCSRLFDEKTDLGPRGAWLMPVCNGFAYRLTHDDAGDSEKSRALAIYSATCDAGDVVGCTNEGVMLERGESVAPNIIGAMTVYERACDAGHPRACAYLGDTILELGVDSANERASRLFESSCDAGDEWGCRELLRTKTPTDPRRAPRDTSH